MKRRLAVLLLSVSSLAAAIVIRHDVDDAKYRVPASEYPPLVDMPGEGHGVLIAPQWVVTVAHTTLGNPEEVGLNGVPRKIERIVVHPGYKRLTDDVIAQAMKSGDATDAMKYLASSDDIALVKLAAPVTDVQPATLYRHTDELGKLVKLIGKGGTGNGLTGQDGPNRTVLRRAYSRVTSADGHWLGYVFNGTASANPLEGMSGNGDSGGPVLIESDGQWTLAGLAAFKYVQSDPATFRTGLYGQTTYNIRLSSYAAWIDSVISAGAK